ncbi:MAG: hypothetical protein N4A54_13380 [Peptostreptococcaceae bacterium]|jgi:hypothetical protein|nr:hypothetical protein [Peptostreptococcaceae bacterium]
MRKRKIREIQKKKIRRDSRANKLYENINADMFITKLDNYGSEITLKGDCNMADNNMKIGSRRLTVKELEVLLKDYKNIYEQIGSIRDNAWELKNKIENDENYRKIIKEEPEFIKHHNNVFSILGTRGSGKSSILISIKYTIMNQIIERKKGTKNTLEHDSKSQKKPYNIESYDTVLPIIAPQDMDEDSESLGWIIGFFEDEVDESERLFIEDRRIFDYQNENCNLCSNKRINTNPLKESYNVVKEAYFKRKKDYKNRLMDVNSDSDYIDLKGETLCQDVSLAKKFKIFIDEFVKYKRAVAGRYKGFIKEPLLFVFFDDVDISTRKCIDVLETIIRYLAHSNIITFVSGNYKTFEETITLRYLEQDGLLDKELQEINFTNSTNDSKNNAMRIRKKLTYDYLKKVLSPALRYHLTKIKDEDKYNFAYRIVEDENEEKTSEKDDGVQLYKLIENAFGLDDDNFMKYELVYPTDDKKYEVMNKFFMPFDNKPRGLINIYYYLNSMSDKVNLEFEKQRKDKKKKILKDIWTESELNKFLTIIITSNSRLDIYRKTIKDVIKIKKNYDGEIDVDVDYFQICEGEKFKNTIVDENTKLQVLILGLFFDGLISNLNNKKSDIFIERYDYDEYKVVCDYLESALSKGDDILFRLIYKTNRVFEILYFYDNALNYSYNNNYMDINNRNFVEYIKNIEKKVKENDKYIKLDEKQLIGLINKKIVIEELESFSNSLKKIDTNSFEYIKNYLTKNIMKYKNIYQFNDEIISNDIYWGSTAALKFVLTAVKSLEYDDILDSKIETERLNYYKEFKSAIKRIEGNKESKNLYEYIKMDKNEKKINALFNLENFKKQIFMYEGKDLLNEMKTLKNYYVEIFNSEDIDIKSYIDESVKKLLDEKIKNKTLFDERTEYKPISFDSVVEYYINESDEEVLCEFNLRDYKHHLDKLSIEIPDYNLISDFQVNKIAPYIMYYIMDSTYEYLLNEKEDIKKLYTFDTFFEDLDLDVNVNKEENKKKIKECYNRDLNVYIYYKISGIIAHENPNDIIGDIIKELIKRISLNKEICEQTKNISDFSLISTVSSVMKNLNYLETLFGIKDVFGYGNYEHLDIWMNKDKNIEMKYMIGLFEFSIFVKSKGKLKSKYVITEQEFDKLTEKMEKKVEEKYNEIYVGTDDVFKKMYKCYENIIQSRKNYKNAIKENFDIDEFKFDNLSNLEKIIIEKDSILIDFSKELKIDYFVRGEYISEKANIICLLYELIDKNRDKISLDNLKFQLSKFDRELHSEFEKDKNKKLSNDELMKIFVYMCFFVIVYKEENKKSKAKEYEIFAKKLRELLGNEYNEQFMELLD